MAPRHDFEILHDSMRTAWRVKFHLDPIGELLLDTVEHSLSRDGVEAVPPFTKNGFLPPNYEKNKNIMPLIRELAANLFAFLKD